MAYRELHFDFTKAATRKVIFGTLIQSIESTADKRRVAPIIDDVSIPEKAQLVHLADVVDAIDKTIASKWAKEQAKEVYLILGQAEAQVHACSIDEIHFHEVGLGMTCREILGICTAFEIFAPQQITATAVQVGSGQVECAHGILDIPAPATAAILEKYEIPLAEPRLKGELCTPTSAALIAQFVEKFDE